MPDAPDTAVTVDPEVLARARREAERRGVTVPELFRISRDVLLDEAARAAEAERDDMPWMELAGSVDGDDPHASFSVDEVYGDRARGRGGPG